MALLQPEGSGGEQSQVQAQPGQALAVQQGGAETAFRQIVAYGQQTGQGDEAHAPEKSHLQHEHGVAQGRYPQGRDQVLVTEDAAVEQAEDHG